MLHFKLNNVAEIILKEYPKKCKKKIYLKKEKKKITKKRISLFLGYIAWIIFMNKGSWYLQLTLELIKAK